MAEIRKVAVIGSGVMGGGIAAQCANAGVPVLLFDVTRDVAKKAIDRLLKTEAFMVAANARLLTPCGIDDDLPKLADCDWIVEAIIEKLEPKRDLYAKIEMHRTAGALVSSNTSTIQLADLVAGLPQSFRRNFLITHFFNPPRLMRLLEIVAGPETDAAAVETITYFADHALGKTIVHCKDRPGFIANRLGCFWMWLAMVEAFAQGLPVEEADSVMGKPFGIPKTGVFGLADLVGIDLIPHVNASLASALEAEDLFHTINRPLPFVDGMIAQGLTGRKGKGGFYRINREAGKRKEAINLVTGDYQPVRNIVLDEPLPLLHQDNAHGRYARSVMVKTLAYAALLVGDAADDIASIDTAMRLGYNWRWGPFELIDRIGLPAFRDMAKAQDLPIAPILKASDGPFYRDGGALGSDGRYRDISKPDGILLLEDVKRGAAPISSNPSASLWDLGDGVACFELTTKMNTLDAGVFDMLDRAIDAVSARCRAMVIYSDGPYFCAGVDLNWLGDAITDTEALRVVNITGETAFKKLRYASFPTVAAVCGVAVGGGCEMQMQCTATQAHAESVIGLTEASVGILPDWGGISALLLRLRDHPSVANGPMPAITRAFELISMSVTSKSAAHAKALGFLRPGDGITMNRDRLLADAKAKALLLVDGYAPPERPTFHLPGPSGLSALHLAAAQMVRLGKATSHDLEIAMAIGKVLTGGDADITQPLTDDDLAALAQEGVAALAALPLTQARITHMRETRKPLRN